MEMQNGSHIVLLGVQNLLVVSAAQESQHHTVRAQRGLDHVGDVFAVFFIVEIGQILSGHLLVTAQVIIGTVRDAPQLTPAEGEQEFHIRGGLAVEGQLLLLMIAVTHFLMLQAQAVQPVQTELLPVVEPLQIRIRLAEELQLHLLKLSGTESEVSGGNLIPEGFSDLSDTEGQLLSGSSLYIFEVYKDTLGGLRTEIYRVFRVLGNTLEGFEHQVELTDIGEIVLSAGGAGNLMLLNESGHLFLAPGVHAFLQHNAFLRAVILDQLVGAESLMTFPAVHQRVGKTAQMTGCHPGLGIHQDGAVHAHVVGILLDELFPPGSLYIILQLHTQISVIPGVGQAAVNLRPRVHKPSGFCQRYNFLHRLFHNFLTFRPNGHIGIPLRGFLSFRPYGHTGIPLQGFLSFRPYGHKGIPLWGFLFFRPYGHKGIPLWGCSPLLLLYP